MPTNPARKLALAAVLMAFSAPASASDAVGTTAQQTAVGQATMEMAASAQETPVVVNDTYATATAAPATAPRARAKVGEPRPLRQSYGGEYRAAPPLILGIRH